MTLLKDLGPPVFSIENRTYQRTDLSLTNKKNLTLVWGPEVEATLSIYKHKHCNGSEVSNHC